MKTLSPHPPNSDDRTWGMLCHLSSLLGMVVPLGNIIGPLIVWSIKKEESEFTDCNGRSSINFQLTWTLVLGILWIAWISMFFSGILKAIIDGGEADFAALGLMAGAIPFLVLLGLAHLFKFILMIVGSIRASSGEVYHYPLAFSFLQPMR